MSLASPRLHSWGDPDSDRPDGSGFAIGCKPIEIIELLFGQWRPRNQRAEQPEQSSSQRALPFETTPN
jgi:hypothetical protein